MDEWYSQDWYGDWNEYFKYIFRRYGVTSEQWKKQWNKQKGKCALCLRKMKLTVDHDHKSGNFRGLLCYGCNGILGKLERRPVVLDKIRAYIRNGTARKS